MLYKKITNPLQYSCSSYNCKKGCDLMANKYNGLAHTKWLCKYHIVFTPKYRRKIFFNQYKESIGQIIRQLCQYKGVEIIERAYYAGSCAHTCKHSTKI